MKTKNINFLLIVYMLVQFFIFEDVSAQRRFRFFYGKVLDQATKLPINNVNFSVDNTTVGTVSDKKGDFSFYLDTIPSILTISHVGYATKKVILDTATYKMTMYLLPYVQMLKEVVISATPHELIFKDEHYAVLDYEIDSGFVYLLVYRYRFSKSELICRTPGGDTIAKSGLLHFVPRKLLCDCIGYLHVLSDDTAYQVYRQGSDLHMIHPVTNKKYDEILSDCVASSGDLLFFKRETDYGLGTEFYTINSKDRTKKLITQFRDEKKVKMLKRNPEDAWMLRSASQPDKNGDKMSESPGISLSSRDAFREYSWVRKIQYPPIKSFLYRIGEFICVFNIPNNQMEFFDLDGNYSYKLQLKAEKAGEGKWTHDIIIDEFNLKVYTTFLKNGVVSLFEIDLNTGELIKKMSVFHFFPQKLKIYDNYIYYLYDDPASPDNKMLFRQLLHQG